MKPLRMEREGMSSYGREGALRSSILFLRRGRQLVLPRDWVPRRSRKEFKQVLRDMQRRLKTANDIVILGGGPAGVELAADSKALYSEKKVTLVHSRTTLLNTRFGSKLHKFATKELEKLGVDLVLGDRLSVVDEKFPGDLVLSSGKKLPCDCLV